MNHLSRHIVGYSTVFVAVLNVIYDGLEKSWPKDRREWVLLGIAASIALGSSLIAYRAPYGAKPNENPPPAGTP